MAILANCPSLSYIYIKDMIITYNNTPYQILNTYTMKPYVYWDSNNPYELITSNTILKEKTGLFYICFNDKGNPIIVPQTDITISFGENTSRDLVTEKILGFKEQNEINEEKFTTIQVDINGIKTTVGKVQNDLNGTKQTISTLEQRDDEINAQVSSLEKEYAQNEELKKLRNNVNISLLNLQSTLGLFSSDMNVYMEDGKLTEEELSQINIHKSKMENYKNNLNSQIDNVITMLESQEKNEEVINLTTQKDLLNTSISNLFNNINTVCTDKIFTNTEMVTIVSCFSNVNTKINETNNMIDEYLFLESGGKIIEKLGQLSISQDEIKQSVSTTENEIVAINGNIVNINQRVSTAEQKITDDAITNTVKKNFYTKNDLEEKNYQTETEVQQTVNGLEIKVKQSGGYNNLFNSGFKKGTSYWSEQLYGTATNKSISTWDDSNQYILPNTKALVIRATDLTDRYGVHQNVKVKEGATYGISALSAGHRNAKQLITIRKASDGAHITNIEANPIGAGKNINNWRKMEGIFTIPSGCTEITVCLYMVGTGNNSDAYVWYTNVLLSESKLVNEWSPHPSEIYDGVTTIDKDGVTVTASNVKSKTNMSANGFKITKTDTNEDVFKVNSDGTLYIKGSITVTGGSIPTSNLSGTISSNQLNSVIMTDINNAKNDSLSALSVANTAKNTADSAKTTATSAQSTANTASTNATNALNTANSVNTTMNNNKANWTNAYNRVIEWAKGAITGSVNINGGMIEANTIAVNKMAIADFTNYCEMNVDNCSVYGFTKTADSSASNNYWMKLNSLARDTAIVSKKNYDAYKGNVQGTYRISFEFNSTVKGATTSGGTDSTLRPIGIGLYCKDKTGASKWYIISCSSFTSGANTSYTGTVTLDSSIMSFGIYVQINGYAPFTGQLLIRNIKVNKMANGELIVDGAITAEKIAAGAITASMITTGTLDASKVNVTNINASNITSGTINGDRISGGTISAANEINFIGGARIFGNKGELGAGLEISAAGITLGGGTTNYLSGNWNVIDGGNLKVSNGDVTANAGNFTSDVGCVDVYASNKVYASGVALTSDKSLKTDIRYIGIDSQGISDNGFMAPNVNITTQDMHNFIETLPMVSYRMKRDVLEDVDYTYYGFIAQDILYTKVGSELIENGTITETETILDENGEVSEVITNTRDILRYSENKFIAFICGALQEEIKQRKALERQLNDLINTINK